MTARRPGLLALPVALAVLVTSAASPHAATPPLVSAPIVLAAASSDVSSPLRDLEPPPRPPLSPSVGATGGGSLLGPVESFEGVANDENQDGEASEPPDTNGAVGPRDYVQWVNGSLAIYDKRGARLLGPMLGNRIWSGFGGLCETQNQGDPIVRYDQLADRWVLTQFAWKSSFGNPAPPYFQCFAVSTSSDPTGTYYRYAFEVPDGIDNDYAKLAVWPSAYFMTDNRYAGGLAGAGAFAFDRAAMLAGRPARAVYFQLGKELFGILPSDLDGAAPPPPRAPDVFLKADDDGCGAAKDQLELWRFSVDFANPAAASFAGPVLLPTAPFDSTVCSSQVSVGQPGTQQRLDLLSDRMMFRASYRNFGTQQSLVALQSDVVAGSRVGLRWYELRDPAGAARIRQQGTYAPDPDSRWMGSAAQDGAGDIAVGFSLAGTSTFPSIGYVGRSATDPLGTLPSGEGRLATGAGSQTGSSRWGDYSSLTVDPVDDCTFWYTQEYYPATAPFDWHTRIGSFRFPGCGPSPALSGQPREGATLTAATGSWPSLPGATFEYEWRRCNAQGGTCVEIPGATRSTYVLGTLDVDGTVRVVVRASTPTATASALSAQTGLVAPTPALGPLPLETEIEAAPASVAPGGEVTYTVTVGNAGSTGSATGVVLSVALPAGTEIVTATAARGSGCTAGAGGAPVVCPLDFLPGGLDRDRDDRRPPGDAGHARGERVRHGRSAGRRSRRCPRLGDGECHGKAEPRARSADPGPTRRAGARRLGGALDRRACGGDGGGARSRRPPPAAPPRQHARRHGPLAPEEPGRGGRRGRPVHAPAACLRGGEARPPRSPRGRRRRRGRRSPGPVPSLTHLPRARRIRPLRRSAP